MLFIKITIDRVNILAQLIQVHTMPKTKANAKKTMKMVGISSMSDTMMIKDDSRDFDLQNNVYE
jgi:ribosomal protein L30/L7E